LLETCEDEFRRWADIATIIGLLDSERSNPPAPALTVRRRSHAATRRQRNRRPI